MANNTTQKNSFPRKELKDWVKGKSSWNHEEWLSLLKSLKALGYGKWTDNEKGRTELGQFLESEKTKG